MKFKLDHLFTGVSIETFETLQFEEEMLSKMFRAVNLSRELKSIDEQDGLIKRVQKLGPNSEIPSPVAKVLKIKRFEYDEYIEYRMGSFKGTWHTIPNVLPGKVVTEGTFEFFPVDNGVRRIVAGETRVKLLAVGGMIEKFIIANLKESYDQAAVFTQEWIRTHPTV